MFTLYRVFADGERVRVLQPVGAGFAHKSTAIGFASQLQDGRYEVYRQDGKRVALLRTSDPAPEPIEASEPVIVKLPDRTAERWEAAFAHE